jgi:uncharacterized membrane protein
MDLTSKLKRHFVKCLLGGLVAALPIGGLALILYWLDVKLRVLAAGTGFDFPGVGLIAGMISLYLLGLIVTTFLGQWLLGLLDKLLSAAPGIKALYQTLKQIAGYGSGKDAFFREVVLVQSELKGTLELGLVTEEHRTEGEGTRLFVFVPGSPNPAAGRLALVKREDCLETKIPVDVALKALFSTGKTRLTS